MFIMVESELTEIDTVTSLSTSRLLLFGVLGHGAPLMAHESKRCRVRVQALIGPYFCFTREMDRRHVKAFFVLGSLIYCLTSSFLPLSNCGYRWCQVMKVICKPICESHKLSLTLMSPSCRLACHLLPLIIVCLLFCKLFFFAILACIERMAFHQLVKLDEHVVLYMQQFATRGTLEGQTKAKCMTSVSQI
ncbi:hypothetical protein RF11_00800 [Thelohanellus kitauei]|uniref:Uncharacterized protein n=1 Tax=Thelohanellus kitauei TaxID=669202 RepID=A0A0C2JQA9_THEKT|nr:hypothetical protein RF11_00800 [Thelohanellus kitauei]